MHNHTHVHSRSTELMTVTLIGTFVNLLLTGAKLAAGVWGKSSAMVADGVHSLSDLISDFVVLFFIRVSGKGRDKDHDFGHGKYETLATLTVSILLVLVAADLMISGIRSIRDILGGEEIEKPGMIALWAAVVSILSKEILFRYTAHVGKKQKSQAVIANAWHHRSDALSSIGSLLGIGGAILLGGKWVLLDPLTSCVISVVIIIVAFKMAFPALRELTDASLSDEEEDKIEAIIKSVKGVDSIHNLKTRRSGPDIIINAHLVVNPEMKVIDAHSICDEVEKLLLDNLGDNTQISLHIEPSDDFCEKKH